MTCFLLDVNVLVALHVPGSETHQLVQNWFSIGGSNSFATCAMTEAGFVRVSSQLSLRDGPIDFREVRIALGNLASLPGHRYWPMELNYLQASEPFGPRMHGPKQVTDAFLLGLAIQHRGKLATLDKAVLHLAGAEFVGQVELIV